MESAEHTFRRTLLAGAQLLGIRLDDDGVSRLVAHFRLLRKWIDRVNLTTVREPGEMAELLYLDSAVLLEHLEPGARAHDVGTGAGFPGLVLKALRLDLEITLTEARRKKVSFLKQAAREMSLTDGLDIRHGRLGWGQAGDEGQWSEVVSRAAFPPEEWIRQGSQLVAPGGRLWIFSGQPHGEGGEGLEGLVAGLDAIMPGGFERGRVHAYRLPFSGKPRLLVPVRRLKEI